MRGKEKLNMDKNLLQQNTFISPSFPTLRIMLQANGFSFPARSFYSSSVLIIKHLALASKVPSKLNLTTKGSFGLVLNWRITLEGSVSQGPVRGPLMVHQNPSIKKWKFYLGPKHVIFGSLLNRNNPKKVRYEILWSTQVLFVIISPLL